MQFKREPALWLALFASAVQMFSAFILNLTIEQQGVLNAVAVAISALLTAVAVRSDQMVPAILGVIKAVLALALAFGLAMSPDNQAIVMTFATATVAMFVRTQVQAPEPPVVKAEVAGA